MTHVQLVSDEEQIAVIDQAIAKGALIMGVMRQGPDQLGDGVYCSVTFLQPHSAEEVEWSCGLAAAEHALAIMSRT